MLSEVAKEMDSSQEITHARILNRLFDESTKKFHTEIHNAIAMSGLDILVPFLYEEFGEEEGDLLAEWTDADRTNMVAKDRARAKEIIEGVKAELQREEQDLRARMLGMQSR